MTESEVRAVLQAARLGGAPPHLLRQAADRLGPPRELVFLRGGPRLYLVGDSSKPTPLSCRRSVDPAMAALQAAVSAPARFRDASHLAAGSTRLLARSKHIGERLARCIDRIDTVSPDLANALRGRIRRRIDADGRVWIAYLPGPRSPVVECGTCAAQDAAEP
jgi:hypothetical protein